MDEIEELDSKYHLSYQEKLQLKKAKSDLEMWGKGPLSSLLDQGTIEKASSGQRAKLVLVQVEKAMAEERKRATDYHDFPPPRITLQKQKELFTTGDRLMGRCPCPRDGELTRCCNLHTLDAVEQCAFACSYCAVQSFYSENQIKVVENLKERLSVVDIPDGTWHIGTGQASDSLLWGDDYGTLTALKVLANRYPDKIIELKTKSARTDWITDDWPKNIVATWSLNAETIVEKEELLTASLESRIHAARLAADRHIPVGFHLHPMVFFDGWEKEYAEVVSAIVRNFKPEEVMMVSFGTLTFTKGVLKTLRERKRPSRILDMELVPFAGKFSYPWETKRKLFSVAWNAFPQSWKQGFPFFYLCFEDPTLWQPVLGRSYPSNQAFEDDMRRSYLETARLFRKKD